MKTLLLGIAALTVAGATTMKPRIVAMSTPRAAHSATLLHDGRVLVVGGTRANGRHLATAELFDPRAMRFTPAGAMPAPRSGHAAILLGDGRVLIAGGRDAGARSLGSALLWDPASGRFTATAPMRAARAHAAAALLPDGRVLLTGGEDAGAATASTEIFDPRTGRFDAGPTMTEPRAFHSATLLDPARLLVSGGGSDARHASRSAEVLDLAAMRFHPVGAMQRARMGHAATRLADGSVLVTGGADGPRAGDARAVTTPTSSTMFSLASRSGSLTEWSHASPAGASASGSPSWNDAERYDPRTASWSPAGAMAEPRYGHAGAASILADGSVFIFGGGMGAEQWSAASGRFAMVPILARWPERYFATATALLDGRVLLLGGADARGEAADEGIVWAGETR